MRALFAAAATCAFASAAWGQLADDETLTRIESAVQKGYGDMCTLTADHAGPGQGYYRCLDIGPYRFVYEYGAMRGYVVVKGGKPFAILEGKDGRLDFLVTGPWTMDLAPRVADWYSDEVEGGREKRNGDQAETKRRQDAEDAVRGYGDPASAGSAPQGAPQGQPSYPQQQVGPGQPVPAPYAPPGPQDQPQYGQDVVPPGARLPPPGVVQEPPGTR